jgi:hypothetical protein
VGRGSLAVLGNISVAPPILGHHFVKVNNYWKVALLIHGYSTSFRWLTNVAADPT